MQRHRYLLTRVFRVHGRSSKRPFDRKYLFDRTYEELRDDGEMYKKPFAVVICAGNDGTMALSIREETKVPYRAYL